jgi:hypothetical protein
MPSRKRPPQPFLRSSPPRACRTVSPQRPSEELEAAAEPVSAAGGEPQAVQAARTQKPGLLPALQLPPLTLDAEEQTDGRWQHEHWQPDTPECKLCQAHFHALRRRHHCRALGGVPRNIRTQKRKKIATWSAPIGQCWRVPPSWAACKLSAADTDRFSCQKAARQRPTHAPTCCLHAANSGRIG